MVLVGRSALVKVAGCGGSAVQWVSLTIKRIFLFSLMAMLFIVENSSPNISRVPTLGGSNTLCLISQSDHVPPFARGQQKNSTAAAAAVAEAKPKTFTTAFLFLFLSRCRQHRSIRAGRSGQAVSDRSREEKEHKKAPIPPQLAAAK